MPIRSAILDIVVPALVSLFAESSEESILDSCIDNATEALPLRPRGHPGRPRSLINLALAKKAKFLYSGSAQDIEDSVDTLREALELLPPLSTLRAETLGRLADALRYRFTMDGDFRNIEESVEHARDAVALCEPRAVIRSNILSSLASSLHQRFGYTGDPEDSRSATLYFAEGLSCSTPRGSIHLNTLVQFLQSQFDHLPQHSSQDLLRQSAALAQTALDSMSSGNVLRPVLLGVLARASAVRFEETKRPEEMEASLAFITDALRSCSRSAAAYPSLLLCSANNFFARFSEYHDPTDLTRCLEAAQHALTLCSSTHFLRYKILEQLGEGSVRLHAQTQDITVLHQAINCLNDALALCPLRSPSRHTCVLKLVNALDKRSHLPDQAQDVERAMAVLQESIPLQPRAHSAYAIMLLVLAKLSYRRFLANRNPENLDALIDSSHKVLASASRFSDVSDVVSAMAFALQERYRTKGQREDLDESIEYGYSALALFPPGHHDIAETLGDLAAALRRRFEAGATCADLDQAIILLQRKLNVDPESFKSSLYLAEALMSRFIHTGRLIDLGKAIRHGHGALAICPADVPERWMLLYQLSTYLYARYDQTEQLEDLSVCISHLSEMLSLDVPEGPHPKPLGRSFLLCFLSACFRARWRHQRDPRDVAESMVHAQKALRASTAEQQNARHVVINFAEHYHCLYEQTGEAHHLTKAIEAYREALSLLQASYLSDEQRLALVSGLGSALVTRYKMQRIAEDLEECIDRGESALSLEAPKQAFLRWQRRLCLFTIATALEEKYRLSGNREDMARAIIYAQESVSGPDHDVKRAEHLQHAMLWARLAHEEHHPSTLDAYRVCLEIMEEKVVTAPTLEMQHDVVRDQRFLPSNAAAYAIDQGNLALAVELLEQGRALLWSQIRRLRTPLDQLEESADLIQLRTAFVEQSHALESIGSSSNPFLQPDLYSDSYGAILEAKRRLAAELDETIEKIRVHIPGFMKRPSFEQLKRAGDEGPVVIVNHSVYRSDALILGPGDSLSCVSLSGEFYSRAVELSHELFEARQTLRTAPKKYDQTLRRTLKALADILVEPVIEKFEEHGVQSGSRIWWCPTSVVSALPLHAAGPLTTPSKGRAYLSDLYIPSYAPTLTALIEARTARGGGPLNRRGLLGVVLLDETLEAVSDEVDVLRGRFAEDSLTIAVGEGCTREAVLAGLAERPWAHFVCHGTLKTGEPFNAAFMLSNGERLTLLDVIKAGRQNAELAVLAACHTAEQTQDSASDEALHLAAAMQFAGFRSVVGTMWQMQDEDGPTFARTFYDALFAEQSIRKLESGYKGAARALCLATKAMRKSKVSLERWVNYVHIGA
ncbi:CHAT domain-containing protein [Phanerochaete sordida]|uniref:CHAT domain-containing protein n=1 Tax=Phanerochaete sordida TaxID=48140 RepID=A0A9P3GE25_9APHY|nr:CHAT domain-containing protein [Phanerochaete sordida]